MAKRRNRDNRKIVPLNDLDLGALVLSAKSGPPIACALICGAYVENALGCLLENVFSPDQQFLELKNRLLNGELAGVGMRANISRLLGLIDDFTYKNAMTIASIRNKFAHSHVTLDFSSQIIKDNCSNLANPPLYKSGEEVDAKTNDLYFSNLRTRLVTVTLTTFVEIQCATAMSFHNETLAVRHPCCIDESFSILLPRFIE